MTLHLGANGGNILAHGNPLAPPPTSRTVCQSIEVRLGRKFDSADPLDGPMSGMLSV